MQIKQASRVWISLALAVMLSACTIPFVSEQELAIESEKQFTQMRNQMVISTDANVRSYVFCVADAIIRELEEPYASMDWDIEVFDNEAVNAFAMPGGKIGVFTGILAVAENQDQLGAVLGHEVAHVTQHHSVDRTNQALTTQVGTTAAGAVLGGGYAGDLVQLGAQLGLTLPYGRGQESEADVVGLVYSSNAGFDPRESVQLWKNMAKASDGAPPEFLSTHPSSDTRIDDLIKELPGSLVSYNQAKADGKLPQCGD
ncbi:MAG: M48 family peptidase [Gammaproteobacteria bacterium]|nr:MAG: M48 family peptidase [Gammaproteobacteria bacterium]